MLAVSASLEARTRSAGVCRVFDRVEYPRPHVESVVAGSKDVYAGHSTTMPSSSVAPATKLFSALDTKAGQFTCDGVYLHDTPDKMEETVLHGHIDNAESGGTVLNDLTNLLYVQLIMDVIANRAQNEHIAPVIHRLNRKRAYIEKIFETRDLEAISTAVSYIDKPTEESIPTLPTGTCIFSGVISAFPLKLNVRPLASAQCPHSATRSFSAIVASQ